MKILLCHNDPKMLTALLNSRSELEPIFVECREPKCLLETVLATEPHVVVVCGDQLGTPESIEKGFRRHGILVPFLFIPAVAKTEDPKYVDAVWKSITSIRQGGFFRRARTRERKFVSELKFQTRTLSTSTAVEARVQEERFLALLARANDVHGQARAYLKRALATEAFSRVSWSSSVFQQDAKAYLWRTQLFRYVCAIAHSIPGVDIHCLPLPDSPSRDTDYLHASLPVEAYYGLSAVCAFGANNVATTGLWDIGQIQLPESESLVQNAARLAGWTSVIRNTAVANDRIVSAFLSKRTARATRSQKQSWFQDELSLFCEFWGFGGFSSNTASVKRVVEEFHNGRRSNGIPPFSSFAAFLEGIQSKVERRFSKN